jgi:hypothetical protein
LEKAHINEREPLGHPKKYAQEMQFSHCIRRTISIAFHTMATDCTPIERRNLHTNRDGGGSHCVEKWMHVHLFVPRKIRVPMAVETRLIDRHKAADSRRTNSSIKASDFNRCSPKAVNFQGSAAPAF